MKLSLHAPSTLLLYRAVAVEECAVSGKGIDDARCSEVAKRLGHSSVGLTCSSLDYGKHCATSPSLIRRHEATYQPSGVSPRDWLSRLTGCVSASVPADGTLRAQRTGVPVNARCFVQPRSSSCLPACHAVLPYAFVHGVVQGVDALSQARVLFRYIALSICASALHVSIMSR